MHNEWTEMSVIMTSTPLSVQVLYWVFFLVAVSAYMLSAGQAILDWLADSAMGYVIDEKASGDGEKTGVENLRTEC